MTGPEAALAAKADENAYCKKLKINLKSHLDRKPNLLFLRLNRCIIHQKVHSILKLYHLLFIPSRQFTSRLIPNQNILKICHKFLPSTVRDLCRSYLWRAILFCLSRVSFLSRLYSNTHRHLFFTNPAEIGNSPGKQNLKIDEKLNGRKYLSQQKKRMKNTSALILPLNLEKY